MSKKQIYGIPFFIVFLKNFKHVTILKDLLHTTIQTLNNRQYDYPKIIDLPYKNQIFMFHLKTKPPTHYRTEKLFSLAHRNSLALAKGNSFLPSLSLSRVGVHRLSRSLRREPRSLAHVHARTKYVKLAPCASLEISGSDTRLAIFL